MPGRFSDKMFGPARDMAKKGRFGDTLLAHINPQEAIKRLAAAQGIDILNLVKTEAQMAQEKEMMMQQQQSQTLLEQTGQLANSKLADGANLQDLSQAIQPSPPQQ